VKWCSKMVKMTIFEHWQNGDPKWSFFFFRQNYFNQSDPIA
jgi:hypothetical protein